MAKQKEATTVVKTAQELMEDLATSIITQREAAKTAKEALDADEDRLKAYMFTAGQNVFGGLTLEQQAGALKLDGAKGKELALKTSELMNELDAKYVKHSLDKDKMFTALASDNALLGILSKNGLTVTQGESVLKLKVVK